MAIKNILLTVNRRLARTIKADRAKGAGLFATFEGKIIAWDDFLQELLDAHRSSAKNIAWQLSPLQEQILWAQSMSHFPSLGFSHEQTIQCARDANTLVKAYQLKTQDLKGYKEDADLFAQAMLSFDKQCQALNAFSRAALIEQLMRSKIKIEYENFYGFGFDELTPAQNALLSHLDIHIEMIAQENHNQTLCKVMANNAEIELYQAVCFAKSMYEKGKSIAIVVPQLQENWHMIERQLSSIFKPNTPYNISSGESLNKQPVIYALLETLKLLGDNIGIHTWTAILNSPFIRGASSEISQRALFDIQLRENESLYLSMKNVLSAKKIPPIFLNILQQVVLIKANQKKSMRDWMSWLKDWIGIWGWTSDRTLNSAEYQAVDTFYEILPALYSLDILKQYHDFSEFLHSLYFVLQNNLFQTETQDKPIQVLGLLEAAGLSFDYIWVVGLTAHTFPAQATPHPFIPNQVQMKHDMPHSTPQRETRVAKRLLDRLIKGGSHVIVSYAEQDDAGEVQLESPLISHIALNTIEIDLPQKIIYRIAEKTDLMSYEDHIGLPLVEGVVKGGSALLKDQAVCPHRAYVKHRLKAKLPKLPVMGLSPMQQGILSHAVLEYIWTHLKSRNELIKLTEDELHLFLQQSINFVLKNFESKISAANVNIEAKRLLNVMTKWIEHEKNRPDFSIMQLEEQSQVTLNGLTFNVKMDRLDKIGDETFLIDYKTGSVQKSVWDDHRMDEPQLPLYAAWMEPSPKGMAFACLKKDKMGFVGVGSLEIPGIENVEDTIWQDLLQTFRHRLNDLAHEIKSGHAIINPKKGKYSCQQCELKAGCRHYTGGVYAR